MNCRRMRELIATDYTDGELDEGARQGVMAHLDVCTGCRQFEEAVRRAAVAPFRDVPLSSAPASVWHKVMRGIERESDGGIRAALRDGWESLIRVRRVAYAAASAVAVVIIAMFLVHVPSAPPRPIMVSSVDTEGVDDYLREQFTSLSGYAGEDNGSSANGESGSAGITSVNFGTVVEEYLM